MGFAACSPAYFSVIMKKKAVIYCSSRQSLPEAVVSGARQIAAAIGAMGGEMVYGGVNAGLMHEVAEAASTAGAKVTGVVPEVFRERADALCDEIVDARDLNDRKGKMIAAGDVFVVLPGGIGTIDEWISTLSDIMVRERTDSAADRPILVWNHEGMYDGIAGQLSVTGESEYARGKRTDRSLIFSTAEELAAALREQLA